jgi:hypothetical protein
MSTPHRGHKHVSAFPPNSVQGRVVVVVGAALGGACLATNSWWHAGTRARIGGYPLPPAPSIHLPTSCHGTTCND